MIDARAYLAAGRRRIAMQRLSATEPRPLRVPTADGELLIHRSTGEPGWQCTYFDEAGEPWGHTHNVDWPKLLEHVHTSGVVPEWRRAVSP